MTFRSALKFFKLSGSILGTIALLGFLANCSPSEPLEAHDEEDYSHNDPFENINRVTFAINQTLDDVLLAPIAETYVGVVPEWGRERVNSVLNNFGEPLNFANSVMQLEMKRAVTSMLRFVFNSTIGLGGLFDVAGELGLPIADEDFGQTLASWGFGEGPYIVLPLFGPSNPRDAIGRGVDYFLDPFSRAIRAHERNQRFLARALDQRSMYTNELETLQSTSIDFYAAMRALYRQYRENDIRNGEMGPEMPIPSITNEEFEDDSFHQAAAKDGIEHE